MATLGQKPATQHVSLQKQTITGNGGTSYSLQQSVGSELDIAVFVNNTRQEPTTAYTASGTSLVMTGAVNASDNFYVIFLGKAIATTGLPLSAVNTDNINGSAVTDAKIAGMAASKLTGALPALDGSALTGVGSAGTVHAYGENNATITLSRGSETTMTGFTLNEIDTNSAFDGQTFTVPSGQAGVYLINIDLEIDFSQVGGDGESYQFELKKNGSQANLSRYAHNSNQGYTYRHQMNMCVLKTLAVNDAITVSVTAADQSGGGGGRIIGGPGEGGMSRMTFIKIA